MTAYTAVDAMGNPFVSGHYVVLCKNDDESNIPKFSYMLVGKVQEDGLRVKLAPVTYGPDGVTEFYGPYGTWVLAERCVLYFKKGHPPEHPDTLGHPVPNTPDN